MSKQHGSVSMREVVEKTFAGIVAAAIIALIGGGTMAMCLPGALLA
jgi:cell division protein FtsN